MEHIRNTKSSEIQQANPIIQLLNGNKGLHRNFSVWLFQMFGFYEPVNMPRSLGGTMKGRVLALTPKDQTRSYT
jgi:hypothetical protein